ncbi:MAG: carbonic anhydrase, partial [Spirochaetes bacterium]|nr:carbonic anhydrase [Spirochaetota bacterium]
MKYHNYDDLLKNNLEWTKKQKKMNPEFFKNLAKSQKPPFLYIGCSDSRMPLDTFTQTLPGEMFVHRNIANQISLTDMNILSVVEYALFQLNIKHIIICGHYDCGGITAAYTSHADGLVENWLRPIKDIIMSNKEELDSISELSAKLNRISELNVIKQIETLLKTSILEKALEKDKKNKIHIHGWVLDLKSGIIKEL